MHTEPLYRLVVDLREERATFLNRLDPLLDHCEVDGSYLFDCVVENCYGVGKTLDQLTAGLSPEMGGKLMHLLEQTWQMINTAICHAERQADAQVKHLYPANWIRMRQTQDSLDMYYTQLSPEDPKRQTQVEGIDPEDQAYLDNVIAGEVATEEAVEKAESDMGLNLQPAYVETTIDIPAPGSPEAEAMVERATEFFTKQYGLEVAQSIFDTGTSKAVLEQHMDEFLDRVKASRSTVYGIAHSESNRLADKFLGSVAEVVGDRASPVALQRFAEQHDPNQLYWGQSTLQNNSVLEAKLAEITHPNRDMIERVVREHNARHTPSQSS